MKIVSNQRHFLILFLSLFATFLINVELTAVNLALSRIANDFSVDLSRTDLILSLYLAFFAVFTMLGGRLGDLWGRKKITIVMLLVFLFSNVLAGFAPNYFLLLTSRCLQGLSAGAMLPNLTAILYSDAPTRKRNQLIGLISAIVGLGTASGPLLGSYITSLFNWRYIFLINVPLTLIVLIGLWKMLRNQVDTISGKIDYQGMLVTMTLILLVMRMFDVLPSMNFIVIGVYVFLLILCSAVWYLHHFRFSNPFISVGLFQIKTYTVGCIIRLFLGFNYYALLFSLGIYFHEVLGFKLHDSGYIYLPMTLSVTICSFLYSYLSRNISVIILLRYGLLIFLAGILALCFSLNSAYYIFASLIVVGGAYGLLYSAVFSVTLSNTPQGNTSEGSGMLYFFNLVGGTLGVSMTGLLFTLNKHNTLSVVLKLSFGHALMLCGVINLIAFMIAVTVLKKTDIKLVL